MPAKRFLLCCLGLLLLAGPVRGADAAVASATGAGRPAGKKPVQVAGQTRNGTAGKSVPVVTGKAAEKGDVKTGAPAPKLVGTASVYATRFHGRETANGEIFDRGAMTAAHRTLPFGTLVRVKNLKNGRSVTVRINDRGPFVGPRIIDLTPAAAKALGCFRAGLAKVRLTILDEPPLEIAAAPATPFPPITAQAD